MCLADFILAVKTCSLLVIIGLFEELAISNVFGFNFRMHVSTILHDSSGLGELLKTRAHDVVSLHTPSSQNPCEEDNRMQLACFLSSMAL